MLIEMTVWEIFFRMLALGLALGGISLGVVAIYFGSKGTRKLGKALLIAGMVVFIFIVFPWPITIEGTAIGGTGEFSWQAWQIGIGQLVWLMIVALIGGGIGVAIMGAALLVKAIS
ncbi:MAG TPA: hypothetical protein HA346_03735 [Thermoplasmata archaeon]|nr:hypothetical protein [Thermoplasmata archaeon]